jgi:hypothetical protein
MDLAHLTDHVLLIDTKNFVAKEKISNSISLKQVAERPILATCFIFLICRIAYMAWAIGHAIGVIITS